MRRALLVVVALVAMSVAAWAQPVINPTVVEFTASADHAAITSYEVGWFVIGSTDPVSTNDIGKPVPDSIVGCGTPPNPVPPPCVQIPVGALVTVLPFNEYVARVRVQAFGISYEWSEVSNPFRRVPRTPGAPAVKK